MRAAGAKAAGGAHGARSAVQAAGTCGAHAAACADPAACARGARKASRAGCAWGARRALGPSHPCEGLQRVVEALCVCGTRGPQLG